MPKRLEGVVERGVVMNPTQMFRYSLKPTQTGEEKVREHFQKLTKMNSREKAVEKLRVRQ